MRIITKATVCEAFGKYQGKGYFVLVFNRRDNMTMGALPNRGVYKTEAAAKRAAEKVLGRKYSGGKVL